MKKSKIVIATVLAATAGVTAQTTWNIDPSHSGVKFSVTHLMISEVEGRFKMFDGKVTAAKDDFTDANIEFNVDAKSISTENDKRDEHLRSAEFFDVEKYPKITFKSKSFKKTDGKNYKLTGDLTIKGVTKTVEFDVINNGTMKDPYGNIKAAFKLTGAINRTDYGLKWNVALEAGGVMVSEQVNIVCDIQMAKAK